MDKADGADVGMRGTPVMTVDVSMDWGRYFGRGLSNRKIPAGVLGELLGGLSWEEVLKVFYQRKLTRDIEGLTIFLSETMVETVERAIRYVLLEEEGYSDIDPKWKDKWKGK